MGLIRLVAWMFVAALQSTTWLLVEVLIPLLVALCLLVRDAWLALRRYREADSALEAREPIPPHVRDTFSRRPGPGS